MPPPIPLSFPYHEIAFKVALAAGIGLLVGLEREWAQKEIGVRTFAMAGLLGMLTSLLTPNFVIGALLAVLLLVGFLNVHSLLKDRSLELTTSLCLVLVFFLGVFVGSDHYFTAATSAIVTMMLLAWKVELERFAGALRTEEIRSAVLLALLSVVVFPLLPDRFVDPWQLINPQQFWVTVVVIAGIGFLNYVLLRVYADRGLYYAAVLGGLVNSTAAAAELAAQLQRRMQPVGRAVGLLLLTNVSMFIRNAIILAIFGPAAVMTAGWSLGAMAVTAGLFAWIGRADSQQPSEPLQLTSPVSLKRVAKFSIIFLVLAVVGTLAQRYFGSAGFMVVSVAGGLVSSASTTATATALLVAGKISPHVAGVGTVLTSIASACVTIPVAQQQMRQRAVATRLAWMSAIIAAVGVGVALVSP